MPAKVPGDVHLDLLANKRIPEPFYRDNESHLQWIQDAAWEYRRTLHVSRADLAHEHQVLVFEGLDAACEVFLNDKSIAKPDNMFREWRIDVSGKLKVGDNNLRIYFPPPLKAAQAVADKDPWRVKTHTEPKVYIRKAAYEYGWDWGPRFVTSGIWRSAYLETWDDARLADLFVEEPTVTATSAHLIVHAEVESSKVQHARLAVEYGLGASRQQIAQDVLLSPGLNELSVPVNIDRPSLWFPAGYGAQPLYHFTATISTSGHIDDSAERKIGLRSIVLRRDPDQWGRSFEFVVNGIPVFIKGADVIPFDSFPSRVTTAQYKHILESARAANMNAIRDWGGGYYETDEFYELCDELGIMVWQDMMFGNDWQPGTYDFKQEIAAEAAYQIRRLRNHPSIILWSGNNETELLRDWNGRGQLPPAVHEHIWQDYLTEFSGVLAVAAAKYAPDVPYWPSSPSADYEDLSDTYQSGDNHDWTVWHGRKDFSAYNDHPWRFVSEFGFQSFPEMKTIETFTTPEDRTSIFTPVMKAHQKNGDGNKLIEEYMNRYYGEPKDFASFLYASQVLQAEAVKTGAEGWRRLRPRTMGTIFWQLNDCWPVASWASMDYYGRWKALQYYARRFYAPVLVSPQEEDGSVAVYVVSDHVAAEQASLSIRVIKFDGTVIFQAKKSIQVQPLSSSIAMKIPRTQLVQTEDANKLVLVAQLQEGEKIISQNLLYLVPTKNIALPHPMIETELTKADEGYDLRLSSPVVARSVYVSFGENDATFSDNYVDLLPRTPVTIHVTSGAQLQALKGSMKIQTLADAFAPAAGTRPQ
ncbi:beta-mannosidase [Silvibacterium dinghuense]|nr:beta-mannosidase [Silvibacterium dinghuense]